MMLYSLGHVIAESKSIFLKVPLFWRYQLCIFSIRISPMKQRQYNTMSDEKSRVNSSYSKVRKICFKTRVKAVPISKALHKFNNWKIESKIIIHSYQFIYLQGWWV